MTNSNLVHLQEPISQIYINYFDIDYINKNLLIPDEFINSIGKLGIDELHGMASIVTLSKAGLDLNGKDFLKRKQLGQPNENDKMFICIGGWSDRHEFLLCCDRSSDACGKIFDYNDAHPWCNGNDYEVSWISFKDFVLDEYNIELQPNK